nr:reductive dehalogenase [Desulfobaculum xiamenense]
MQTGNRLTGNHGEGNENRGPLAWDNNITSADLASFPRTELPPEDFTRQVKVAARLGGANLVGVCKLNRRWVYESTQRNVYSPDEPQTQRIVFRDVERPTETPEELVIPESVQYAVVMAVEMPRTVIQSSPGPAAGIGDALGYSRMGWASVAVAEYIRCMGYIAIPCKNDTALSVPLAIEAGLGEAGRMGALITPEFGPCVRLCKVFTNMPLVPDKPIRFGVEEFCNHCKKCARECPSKCITEGEQTWEPRNECNNGGVKKWYNDYKKCLGFWDENGMSCTNCVAVCPFTKGDMWAHHFTEWSIKNIHASHPVWLNLDDAFGYGERRHDLDVFKRDFAPYGMDPDKMER